MTVDVVILVTLVGFTVYGYASGLVRSLNALALPVLGVWLGFRHYPALAPIIDEMLHCYPASAGLSFLAILVLTWLGLAVVRRLLLKLVDWRRLEDVDSFLGGVFGLAKGLAIVGVLTACVVAVVPSGRQLVNRSPASSRILDLTEWIAGRRIHALRVGPTLPGMSFDIAELRQAIGSVRKTVEIMKRLESPYSAELGE